MAIRACGKAHVFVARWKPRLVRFVALLALHLQMQTGQEVARLRMIEFLGSLPIGHVVTALAIIAELAFVRIGVAGSTIPRQPKERPGSVLIANEGTFRRNHILGNVTLLAG